MRDVAICTFTGRLGADAELRYTAGGAAVCNIRIAVGRDYKAKDSDQWEERTLWMSCRIWNRLGERSGDLRKGQVVMVVGELEPDDYTDGAGNKVSRVIVNVNQLERIDRPSAASRAAGGAPERPAARAPAGGATRQPSRAQERPVPTDGFEDDEIPF